MDSSVSHIVALARLGQDKGALRVDLLVEVLGVKGPDESGDVEHAVDSLGRSDHVKGLGFRV
jgi:hypothetical protein